MEVREPHAPREPDHHRDHDAAHEQEHHGVASRVGAIGNAAYGFEAIHESLGDTALVDRDGAAVLIKPFGLLFPLSLALVALAVHRLGHRWNAAAVLVAALLWPVAHIANVAPLAVAVNVVLVVALGTAASWTPDRARGLDVGSRVHDEGDRRRAS